jgi:hypothetical protein
LAAQRNCHGAEQGNLNKPLQRPHGDTEKIKFCKKMPFEKMNRSNADLIAPSSIMIIRGSVFSASSIWMKA